VQTPQSQPTQSLHTLQSSGAFLDGLPLCVLSSLPSGLARLASRYNKT
jgi:hypothetical protein